MPPAPSPSDLLKGRLRFRLPLESPSLASPPLPSPPSLSHPLARQIPLSGPNSVVGRAFVIHELEDDLGKGERGYHWAGRFIFFEAS